MAASNVTKNSPVYTRLVDDSSPLLLFDPANAWNHTAEEGPDLYVNSTHSSSDISGATCQFSFNGTGFSVLGARKPNYGEYLILLDGEVQQFSNATAQQTEFGQVLGTASGLEDGLHTVVFMAAGGGPVDIDAIVYETSDQDQSHSSIQTASAPSSSSSQAASSLPLSSSRTISSAPSSSPQTTSSSSLAGSQNSSIGSSSGLHTSSVPSSTSSQVASSPAPSNGNRISANPNTQGPNEPAPSQNASVASASSSRPVTPSSSASATASLSGRLSSQSNAQPSDSNTATAHQGAQPTAQPGLSGSTRSSASSPSASGPSVSQAEQANSPQIAGTSASQKGLPTGAIVGIGIVVAVALLLIVALLFCLMRRRRRAATARKRMAAGLPSPILPLQDPSRHASYFFGGNGNNANSGPNGGNGMRELYLAQGPQNSVTMQGRSAPYMKAPNTLAPTVIRDSVHSNSDTATLVSEGGYLTDASSKTIPIRPPRPPNVRLSIV